jgi:undecaprenyl-diphosphatase
MLHTGTMFAVIVYFWGSWLDHYCSDAKQLESAIKNIGAATVATVVVGFALKWIIEKVFMHGQPKAEIELLFSHLPLIGGALAAAGVLILFSGTIEERRPGNGIVDVFGALVIGVVQGLCLPFRGFSRSGGTISAGLLLGIRRRQIEEFSFALAVVLTPIVVGWELLRLVKAHPEVTHGAEFMHLLTPGLVGMVCSFVAGYIALKLLSRLLEGGNWKYFGYYCLAAAIVVFSLAYSEKAEAASPETSSTTTADTNAAPVTPIPDATTNMATPAPITNAETTPVTPVSTPAAPATDTPSTTTPSTEPVAPRAMPVNASDLTNADTAPAGVDVRRGASIITIETNASPAIPATNSAPANVPAQ